MKTASVRVATRNVLIALDFSAYSEAALAFAFDNEDPEKACFHLVHVDPRGSDDADNRSLLERIHSLVGPRHQIDLTIEPHVLHGNVPETLARFATDNSIDLIVLGTHGRSSLAHLAYGSVAEKVIRTAPCPVTVVKPSADQQKDRLNRAARLIHELYGDALEGHREETTARIKSRLGMELDIHDIASADLFSQLCQRGVLTWNPEDSSRPGRTSEHWVIDPDAEAPRRAGGLLRASSFTSANEPPALDLVMRALSLRASDIHIDPQENDRATVRFRVDGQLQTYCEMTSSIASHMIQQLKVLARIEIADPFRALEGRLLLPDSLRDRLEVRLTSVPVFGGEAVSLRLFDRARVFIPLDELGFSQASMASIDAMQSMLEGMVLVTGPTGTGKTTTVYSMLETLSGDERNIVSIEDPVEFDADFVRQISIDEHHDLTFSSALKTVLRMDPDVVFVGEIRDFDTINTAMRAASSGRYVFSTLHTRDIVSTITAIREIGVENQTLANNLRGIITQRLVRTLCPHCREQVGVTDRQRNVLEECSSEVPDTMYESKGCRECHGTGILGRTCVSETLAMTAPVQDAIAAGLPDSELRNVISSQGTTSLQDDAIEKLISGKIDFREAMALRCI